MSLNRDFCNVDESPSTLSMAETELIPLVNNIKQCRVLNFIGFNTKENIRVRLLKYRDNLSRDYDKM